VDGTTVYQHIDTGVAARALRNPPGGVQTNRDSAIQIEVVGFAHRPKTRPTLENVRRLCRWIESTHNVPKVWPSGPPKPARNGNDPGGHNRSAGNWDTKGGHYGHSHVPENTHWDPAYTEVEVGFLMLDSTEGIESDVQFESIIRDDPGLEGDYSRMPDHSDPNQEEEARKPVRKRRAQRAKAKPRKAAKAAAGRKRVRAKAKKSARARKKTAASHKSAGFSKRSRRRGKARARR
jgi:hypothetical protein